MKKIVIETPNYEILHESEKQSYYFESIIWLLTKLWSVTAFHIKHFYFFSVKIFILHLLSNALY